MIIKAWKNNKILLDWDLDAIHVLVISRVRAINSITCTLSNIYVYISLDLNIYLFLVKYLMYNSNVGQDLIYIVQENIDTSSSRSSFEASDLSVARCPF